MTAFSIFIPPFEFGANCSHKAIEKAAEKNRILICTGKAKEKLSALLKPLETRECFTLSIEKEPSLEWIQSQLSKVRKFNPEIILAIGGGSVLDASKALGAFITNLGDPIDYLEVIGSGRPLKNDSIPVFAVPTTAGTGSEMTKNAVLSSQVHKTKVSLRSPKIYPHYAFIDPLITQTCPPHVTAFSGIDAFIQLIESFLSIKANPLTKTLCLDGIKLVNHSLLPAFHCGHDLRAREGMSLAALYSGIALANSGLGAVHGLAGPLGGDLLEAPHGALCGALFCAVLEMNLSAGKKKGACLDRFEQLFTQLNQDSFEKGIIYFKNLISELKIPSLTHWGFEKKEISSLVQKSKLTSSMKGNPIELSEAQLSLILEKSL